MLWFTSVTLCALSVFWLLCRYCLSAEDTLANESNKRQRRNLPLVFPEGGIFKLLLGWTIPVKNPADINLIFAYNFQYQYPVPPNISFFSQYYPYSTIAVARKKRSEPEDTLQYEKDRYIFYHSMEHSLDGFGVNGRECLLRTICEAAETPIYHNGYTGELFHLLLTPKYIDSGNQIRKSGDADYTAARQAGEKMFDCRELYPKCPVGHGLFDLISVLE